MNSEGKAFTIFTGTYNSGDHIYKVFSSILNQTFKNFEWIIIDDASNDGTPSKVKEFIKAHPELDITFIENTINNGVALNRKKAIEIAKGTYFTSWDHDDEQNVNQLSVFYDLFKENENKNVGFLFAKCENQNGEILGKPFPSDVFVANYLKIHNEYFINNKAKAVVTEHQGCMPTKLNRELLNEILSNPGKYGKCGIDGGDLWGLCAYLGYNSIFTNFPARKYYVNFGERVTMSSANRKSYASTNYYSKLLWVNYFNSMLGIEEIKWKLRTLFAVCLYGLMSDKKAKTILKDIKSFNYKILVPFLMIPALLLNKRLASK